ncbi:trypsin-like serine peptidase [Kitasatospora sp. NPDC054939]
MSSIRRTARAALGASVVALTMVAATACGPENEGGPVGGGAAPTAAVSESGKPGALPFKLPTVDELKGWKFEDWDRWAQQNVITPAVKGFWDLQKILTAKPVKPAPGPTTAPTAAPTAAPTGQPTTAPTAAPTGQPPGGGNGTDPKPKRVEAKPVAHPYAKQFHVNGKIFFDDGKQNYVCSGTVVADPANPGKSNLVWTASHCLHSGKGGKYYTNVTFAPAFNSSGAVSGGKKGTLAQAAPYGEWGAVAGMVSPQWAAEADAGYGGPWSQYDWGIIKVANPEGGGKSLEETVGGAVPIWFNAPRDQLTSVSNYGFPAGKPFDGMELEYCEGGRPVRHSPDPARPAMLTIGCNATGGGSGGGWFATRDGKQVLVSDTSIGGDAYDWEAGPYLEDVAKNALDYFSKKAR